MRAVLKSTCLYNKYTSSMDKRQITAQKEMEMKAELEKLSLKFEEEIARAEENASLKAEQEWKRKLSFGRREAIAETANKAAAGLLLWVTCFVN